MSIAFSDIFATTLICPLQPCAFLIIKGNAEPTAYFTDSSPLPFSNFSTGRKGKMHQIPPPLKCIAPQILFTLSRFPQGKSKGRTPSAFFILN
jgi:hypothetical protein